MISYSMSLTQDTPINKIKDKLSKTLPRLHLFRMNLTLIHKGS